MSEKVFISSVISGYEPYRAAARDAVETLGYEPIMAEDFPAADQSPQQACLDGVRLADVVVLLVADRYGDPQQSGRSATHEEFEEARSTKPVLVFVHDGVDRDDATTAFQREVEDWSSGAMASRYQGPDELRRSVTRSIAEHFRRISVGTVDNDELRSRLDSHLSSDSRASGWGEPKRLLVAVVAGPTQQVLRPAQIESGDLHREILQLAMFGPHVVISATIGARPSVDQGGNLTVGNDREAITLSPLGDITVVTPLDPDTSQADRRPAAGMGVIEDDVYSGLQRSLAFAASLLELVDDTHRLTTVAPAATIEGVRNGPWVSRFDAERSQGMTGLGLSGRAPEPVS